MATNPVHSKFDLRACEIQLLQLLPGDWQDDLHSKIFAVRLDVVPSSKALSYAWKESDLSDLSRPKDFVMFKWYKGRSYRRGREPLHAHEMKRLLERAESRNRVSKIVVNGRRLQISSNLEDALRGLRRTNLKEFV